jgi:glycine/D-amino acid oxidase-like deaminating enzyme
LTDGFPIISRDMRLQNFYHAVGLNGHGITLHAGAARAATALLLHDSTSLDLSDMLGRPARLNFSALDAGRFARGELLKFELRDTISLLSQTTGAEHAKE